MNTAVLLGSSGERPRCFEPSGPCYGRLQPGRCLGGKYEIRGVLGEGGFAVVYEAEHLTLSVPVAVKVLHVSAHTTQEVLGRFRQEAKLCASIRHPNVPSVHDAGTLEDGSPYFVMERIGGETLHARMRHGLLPILDVLEISVQLTAALCALQRLSIVHCDIKPKNVMITGGEDSELRLKLVDFGIAVLADSVRGARSLPSTDLLGTPHYMSPEHLRGEDVDARSDIYATGVVLYEVITGELPSVSEFSEARRAERMRKLRRLRRDCPAALTRVVLKALEPERAARYESPRQMRQDLEVCLDAYSRRHPFAGQAKGRPQVTTTVFGRLRSRMDAGRLWSRRVCSALTCARAAALLVLSLTLAASAYLAMLP